MKRILILLSILLLTACASQPKPVRLVFDDRDVSGKYKRIYTRAALLPASGKARYTKDFLMFLIDRDEQGMLLLSSSNFVDGIYRVGLSIDGQELPLLAQEKFVQHTDQDHKQGMFFPVSRELMQTLASSKEAVITINREVNYSIDIPNSAKDRLSLLLLTNDYVTSGKQWNAEAGMLTADTRNWLKQLSFREFEQPLGKPHIDPAIWSRGVPDNPFY